MTPEWIGTFRHFAVFSKLGFMTTHQTRVPHQAPRQPRNWSTYGVPNRPGAWLASNPESCCAIIDHQNVRLSARWEDGIPQRALASSRPAAPLPTIGAG